MKGERRTRCNTGLASRQRQIQCACREATTGEQMVNLVRQDLPDVAFVDIRMPGLNGLEAIKAAKTLSPLTKWFILTGFPEFDYAHEAIRLGVSGYLLKPISPAELKKILDDFAEARSYTRRNRRRSSASRRFHTHS